MAQREIKFFPPEKYGHTEQSTYKLYTLTRLAKSIRVTLGVTDADKYPAIFTEIMAAVEPLGPRPDPTEIQQIIQTKEEEIEYPLFNQYHTALKNLQKSILTDIVRRMAESGFDVRDENPPPTGGKSRKHRKSRKSRKHRKMRKSRKPKKHRKSKKSRKK